jgi:phage-related protein
VYIDCKDFVVYSQNGSTKTNRISDFSGEFPELVPGENQFPITGTITELTIEFDYKNTYL